MKYIPVYWPNTVQSCTSKTQVFWVGLEVQEGIQTVEDSIRPGDATVLTI